MKRSFGSLFICACFALALSGCGLFSDSSSSGSVNVTTLLANATNSIAQLEAAYDEFYPQIANIEAILAAGKTNAAIKSAVGPRAVPAQARRAAAVICGLTRVDPKAYGGWSGDCPGCDVDAQAFAVACQSEGIPYEMLLNEKASYPLVLAAAKRAIDQLNAGDLLIPYISGHGGQTAAAGDASETDGKSETICLYDGQLVDDKVWELLQKAKAKGVRVWMITDTCNSGSNYRSPHNYTRALKSRLSPSDPQLLHWGGCADGKSSFGSAQGGTFTTALVDSYKKGQSYADWFKSLSRRMPLTQRPAAEFTGDDFQTLPAFR